MRVPYKVYPRKDGAISYHPLVLARARKKGGLQTPAFEALVDSGSSDCIFSGSVAVRMGIVIESGIRDTRQGIGGTQEVWVHPIELQVGEHVLRIHASFLA